MLRRFAFGLLALVACNEKAPPPVAPVPVAKAAPAPTPAQVAATAPPSAGAPSKDLGGGYKDAKWGFQPAQVEAIFGAPSSKAPEAALPDRLAHEVFALKDDGQQTRRELVTYFLDGKLFRVMLLPNYSPGFVAGLDALEQALTTKYGPGTVLVDAKGRHRKLEWDDGTTRIEMTVALAPPAPATDAGAPPDRRIAQSAAVSYTSKAHEAVANEAIVARRSPPVPQPAQVPAPPK